jgi:hypothetical protein
LGVGAAVKPWRSAFSEERCLPESVRGPVECLAFARFARVRGLGVGDLGLGTGLVIYGNLQFGCGMWVGGQRGEIGLDC